MNENKLWTGHFVFNLQKPNYRNSLLKVM